MTYAMNKRPIDPKSRKGEPQRPRVSKKTDPIKMPKGKEPKVPVLDRGVAPGITG